jgi:hypothetical protein
MKTIDLSDAFESGRKSSRALSERVGRQARHAVHDLRDRTASMMDRQPSPRAAADAARRQARGTMDDLRDLATAFMDRGPRGRLAEARSFGRRNSSLLIAGGAALGLAAGGLALRALMRKAKARRLNAETEGQLATPADKLGRDPAHQGESAGLAEFVKPDAGAFPRAVGAGATLHTDGATRN